MDGRLQQQPALVRQCRYANVLQRRIRRLQRPIELRRLPALRHSHQPAIEIRPAQPRLPLRLEITGFITKAALAVLKGIAFFFEFEVNLKIANGQNLVPNKFSMTKFLTG